MGDIVLLYKDDWEGTKERYRAWWAGEYFGRCALAVTAPRSGVREEPEPEGPKDVERYWSDLDYWVRRRRFWFERTFYGGEAFPIWHCGYPGRENIGTFLGSPLTLGRDTGWGEPVLTGEDLDVRGLSIDPEGRWWKFTLRILETGVGHFRGAAIPSIGAFGASGDTLAHLRGSDRLLLDLVDRPGQVAAAELYLMEMWCEVYDRFHAITREVAEGSTCWFPLWSPGKFYAAQCDFAYMISPKMFREIFLPAIERQARFLDHCVYHLDGVGNFAHLDALLELPRIGAFQVLPGEGKPGPLHYLEVLRKVQSAGRNLHITIPAAEIREALAALSAGGLFIQTSCGSEEEAQALIRKAEKWSRERRGSKVAHRVRKGS